MVSERRGEAGRSGVSEAGAVVMEPGGVLEPFYDPGKTYEENFEQGPFGLFAEAGDNKQEQKQIPFPPHRAKNARRGPGFGNDKKEGNDKEKNKQQSHRFLGMSVDAPFGVPAGPLLNGRFVKAALDWGFDIPVYKTVRTRRYACHAWPNVLAVKVDGDLHVGRRLVAGQDYGEPLSITNSFGVPSYDPAFWQPDMADAARHARPGQMVVGSFQGTRSEGGSVAEYVADFALAARLVKETGVHAMEVNLSCPNEGTGNLLCFDAARSRAVLEAIRQEIGDVPLVIKMAYYQREDGDARLEAFVREVGGLVDGIAAINTVSAEIVDEHGRQALPGEGRLRSGVCGEAIRWAGLEMTQRLAQLRERLGMRFEIVGVGGVGDAAAFDAYRRAGADAVMSATAAMWNPRLAIEVKERSHEL